MVVDSIRVHVPTGQHVVILKEKAGDRYLPIWIGVDVAKVIVLGIRGITPDRPITHDLIVNVFGAAGITVDNVLVTGLANEVFYARIRCHDQDRVLELDSRPSDAIAVAVRVAAAIYVADEVLQSAAVMPEIIATSESDPEAEQRSDQMRDWINSLELPDLGGDPPSTG